MPCHGLSGCFQHAEVNIGWYPFRATRETEVRTLPGGGIILKLLVAAEGIGVQSARNPDRHDKPPMRESVIGVDGAKWVWCYSRYLSKTGWVRFADIEYHSDAAKHPLGGPAGIDFEVGRTVPRSKSVSGCGDKTHLHGDDLIRVVDAREVYLRYSPRGTAFHYLHRGDRVKLCLVNGPHGFVCVTVDKTVLPFSTAKPGSSGWTSQSALKRT